LPADFSQEQDEFRENYLPINVAGSGKALRRTFFMFQLVAGFETDGSYRPNLFLAIGLACRQCQAGALAQHSAKLMVESPEMRRVDRCTLTGNRRFADRGSCALLQPPTQARPSRLR
jgi:hypothetical protein